VQVGEEEKDTSELLPAWGNEVAAAVTKLAAPSAHSSSSLQDAEGQHQEQQQQAAGHAQSAAGSGSSSAAADASVLAPGGSIELRNVYFEAVPLSLVSAVISDKGMMSQGQVAELMQGRGKGYEHAFGLSLPDDMLAA
jgi:translation initiation factor 2B subunit (eIF-2B alpha/beta/delta family)